MKGAVAAGSPLTVEAGLDVLRKGGNAVDAAIAATLMAGVAEPLLTGLGGAGVANIRFDGKTRTCDMFANMPGLGDGGSETRPMVEVCIDFGPTTQTFLVGKGSAAVPGIPSGLWAMHERFGSIPFPVLAAPAVRAARAGVTVTPGFARVCELLWSILDLRPEVRDLFSSNGNKLREGDTYLAPNLARTLEEFAETGDSFFRSGGGSAALLSHLGDSSRMTAMDLQRHEAIFEDALAGTYREARFWVPGAPSTAGITVLQALLTLEASGSIGDTVGAKTVETIRGAIHDASTFRLQSVYGNLFRPGFVEEVVRRNESRRVSPNRIEPGYTTHISAIDEQGNAVAITHSLGETAGELAGDSGILINNFLGEEDVNPPEMQRPAGSRLLTMCCPTILQTRDGTVLAMGSGGSSRIPTAVLHGIMYLVDQGATVEQAVRGPRTHTDCTSLHVESDGRSERVMKAIAKDHPGFIRFDGPNMFFGGLHVAGLGPNGFVGFGDPRRSGAFGAVR